MAQETFYRQYILETCQWLFDQEIRIVLFMDGLNTSGTYTTYHGLIIPKKYSLKSLSQCDLNEKILLHAYKTYYGTQKAPCLDYLFEEVQRRMSQIFNFNSSEKSYLIDKSKIPARQSEEEEDVTPVQTTAAPVTQIILPDGTQPLDDDDDMSPEELDITIQRIRKSQTPLTEDSTHSMGPRSSLEIADEERRKNLRERIAKLAALTTKISGDDSCKPEASASTASITPSAPSLSSETTQTIERENVLELNRKIIREELTLAIRGIFGSFAEHMKGD